MRRRETEGVGALLALCRGEKEMHSYLFFMILWAGVPPALNSLRCSPYWTSRSGSSSTAQKAHLVQVRGDQTGSCPPKMAQEPPVLRGRIISGNNSDSRAWLWAGLLLPNLCHAHQPLVPALCYHTRSCTDVCTFLRKAERFPAEPLLSENAALPKLSVLMGACQFGQSEVLGWQKWE